MAIAFGRSSAFSGTGASPLTASLVINLGETVVVCVTFNPTTCAVTGVTDNAAGGSSVYTKRGEFVQSTSVKHEYWSTDAGGAKAATTVSAAFSGTNSDSGLVAAAYTGVLGIGSYASGGGATGTHTLSLTTQDANNWVVAHFADLDNVTIPTAGTGNLRQTDADVSITQALVDNTAASANTSVTCSLGAPTTTPWAAGALELRSVSGATYAKPSSGPHQAPGRHPAGMRARAQTKRSTDIVPTTGATRAAITVVQPKKRKRRGATNKLLRPATTRALRPTKPQTIVTVRKRRKRPAEVTVITGARRSPARPPKQILQVVPNRRRKRSARATLVTGAQRATAQAPAIRPSKPINQVTPKKRRRRQRETTVVTGARRATSQAPAIRPAKPITQVTPKKRRRRQLDTTVVTGARRATQAAPAVRPNKPIKVVAVRKRRAKAKPAQILKPARGSVAAPQKKRAAITVIVPKRKRRAKGKSTRITARRTNAPASLNRAIAISNAALVLSSGTTAALATPQQNIATVSLGRQNSNSIALSPVQSGTVPLTPLD